MYFGSPENQELVIWCLSKDVDAFILDVQIWKFVNMGKECR